jgi:hypothetical protein
MTLHLVDRMNITICDPNAYSIHFTPLPHIAGVQLCAMRTVARPLIDPTQHTENEKQKKDKVTLFKYILKFWIERCSAGNVLDISLGGIEKDRYRCTCPWGLSPEASAPITVLRLAFAAFISIHRY